MMKCTNAEWLEKLEDINAILNATGVIAFVAFKNFQTILAAIQDYIEQRNDVIQTYGTPNESGSYDILDPESIIKANEILKPYSELEQELSIVTVPETTLLSVPCGLNVSQLNRVAWMIQSDGDFDYVQNMVNQTAPVLMKGETEDAASSETEEAEPYDPKDPVTDPRFV